MAENRASVTIPGVTDTIYVSIDWFMKAADWERSAEASGVLNGRSACVSIGKNGDWTSTGQAASLTAVSDDHLIWGDFWGANTATATYDEWVQIEIAIRPDGGGDFETNFKIDGSLGTWTGIANGNGTDDWDTITVGAFMDFNDDGYDRWFIKNVQVATDTWVSSGGTVIWDDSFSGGFTAWDSTTLNASSRPYTSDNVTPPSEPGAGTAYYLAGGFEEWKRKVMDVSNPVPNAYCSIELMIPQEYYDNIIWSATNTGAETHRSRFLGLGTTLELAINVVGSNVKFAAWTPAGEAGSIFTIVPDQWYQFELGAFGNEPGINSEWAYAVDGTPISFTTTSYVADWDTVKFGCWDAGFGDLNQADAWDNYFLRNFAFAFDTWISDGGTVAFSDDLDGTFQTYSTSFGDNFFFQIP